MENDVLLKVQNLVVHYETHNAVVEAVNNVSFEIRSGQTLGLVGETGAGKTTIALAIMSLLPKYTGKVIQGSIEFDGRDLRQLSPKEMRSIRGAEISMIFQEPMTSLNPVYTVGSQLSEVIRTHMKVSRQKAWELGVQALESVGIPDPEQRMKNYPFEMSGGMRQRVMIAIAVACRSKLIIADEPTTALDVTTQAQVMELLMSLVEKMDTSLIVVTHNLGLVTRYADRIYVMYAGRVVESGTTRDLLTHPQHPYTIGLLKSVPRLDEEKGKDLVPIHGAPPNLAKLPATCAFLPRCPYACEQCRQNSAPELRKVGEDDHCSACYVDMEVTK